MLSTGLMAPMTIVSPIAVEAGMVGGIEANGTNNCNFGVRKAEVLRKRKFVEGSQGASLYNIE